MADVELTALTPPKLDEHDQSTIFEHVFRRLAVYRNTVELYAEAEYSLSTLSQKKSERRDEFNAEILKWAQGLLEKLHVICGEPGGSPCPRLDPLSDTSTGSLSPLPSDEVLTQVFSTLVFLDVSLNKEYSSRTRAFLSTMLHVHINEDVIVKTLRNPERAIENAQKQADEAKASHASKGKFARLAMAGGGAVLGGVLIGVTGGLAAPLVGAGLGTVLTWLGVAGSTAGMLATGLAGSSVVCGTLFGAYGANSTKKMVERHSKEVRDLSILPVRTADENQESLPVRLCVSGWINEAGDVTAPWTVFGGDDTYALRWELEALEALSSAFGTLVKSHAIKYVKAQVIRRTVLASLMSSLAPLAWLNIGQIIDNPWMNAKALAIKTGAVLGNLLASHAFGTRPATLTGYSLGSLVIFEALKYLATLPPSETAHLIQDVFLYGTPTSTDPAEWSAVRRVVAGRLLNGYAEGDYILAVLSRASSVTWSVAGMTQVDVQGVENVRCEGVDGHLKWRGMIGQCLMDCDAPGISKEEVEKQLKDVAKPLEEAMAMSEKEANEIADKGSEASA